MAQPLGRIVLTGAAGRLGQILRAPLRSLCKELLSSDLRALEGGCASGERFVACDLADHAAVGSLIEGCEAVVHFGGVSNEASYERLRGPNLDGVFNLYDQALRHGVRRIVLASTSHVAGARGADETIGAELMPRADSLYAASKVWAETLSRFYFDRHGIETVCLRIGSCLAQPGNQRSLRTWLSHHDLIELVFCALLAPQTGHAVVWGVSEVIDPWWRGDDATRIGYRPVDRAADWLKGTRNESAAVPIRQGGAMFARDYRDPRTLFPNPAPGDEEQSGD